MKILSIILLSLSFSAAMASDINSNQVDNVYVGQPDRTYVYALSNELFRTSPEWIPGKGDPALSVDQAYQLAVKELNLYTTDPEMMRLVGADLYRFRGNMKKNFWYYRFTFNDAIYVEETAKEGRRIEEGMSILVLLSGDLPKPTMILKTDKAVPIRSESPGGALYQSGKVAVPSRQ